MIRQVLREDLKALEVFFELVIRDTYVKEGIGHLEKEILEEVAQKMTYVSDAIGNNESKHYFLLALEDKKIIGCAAYGPSSHLIYDHIASLKDVVELGSVLIDPVYQNMGYGKALVDKVIDEISTFTDEFCLDSGYTIAKKIWTKKFGQPKLILKDFWGPGFDHYIWHINL